MENPIQKQPQQFLYACTEFRQLNQLHAVYLQDLYPYLYDERKGGGQLFNGPLSYARDIYVEFVCFILLTLKVKVAILIVMNSYIVAISDVLTYLL